MPWNPNTYNQFKTIRYQPFFDLLGMISDEDLKTAVDIGCGTGEQTSILSDRFDTATFLGVDASKEMLEESKPFANNRIQFKNTTIANFVKDETTWDLIFSNAALHWEDQHAVLFPKLISKLNDGGQFAVQMPVQNENVLNQILLELVQEEPFAGFLGGWKITSPVLSIDDYAQLMFDNGLTNIQVVKKVYPIIAESPETLFKFISGSALIPYMERLSESQQKRFETEYKSRIENAFKRFPAMYSFKRILLYGRK